MVLEKTLESSLDYREIQPVHPKDQSRLFIGRTDVEAETQLHLAGQPDECFLYLSMYLSIYLPIYIVLNIYIFYIYPNWFLPPDAKG